MSVSLYFGLPGCGKSTMLARLAWKGVHSHRYQYIFSNVGINIPGVTLINNSCIGQYDLHDCLILIDEATLYADSRDYKNFSKSSMTYFLEHRHYNADIVLFTQQWDGVDRKIRVITDRVYYVFKGKILGRWISTVWRIPYGILFPNPKKTGDKLGEIIQGYSKPPLFVRIFALRFYRPTYYKYFDSWERPALTPLPDSYIPIPTRTDFPAVIHALIYKSHILSRSVRKYRKAEKKKNRKKNSV